MQTRHGSTPAGISVADRERIETLLAMALFLGQADEVERTGPPSGVEPEPAQTFLGLLDPHDRPYAERQAQWYAALARDERRRWLVRKLARARDRYARLDPHVDASQVTEALRGEPPRIQAIIIRHLPRHLADKVALALGISSSAAACPPSAKRGALSPAIVRAVRREFLSQFVQLEDLDDQRELDHLSGTKLARLVRLLGVRETAIACRGITAVETVAAFLRRFPPEDAQAIVAHLTTLLDVEPSRVAFAASQVERALGGELDGDLLDRIGMRLLAIGHLTSDEQRLRYTAQKLPVVAAGAWRALIIECRNSVENEMKEVIAHEIEVLAASLRRPMVTKTSTSDSATTAEASAPAPEESESR